MSFPCTGCGACCMVVGSVLKNIDKYPSPHKEELEVFPFSAKEDGSCEKLIDGSCSVYNDRQTICNIEEMYEKHYSDVETIEEHYSKQKSACKTLIIANKLDKKFIPQ